MSNCQRGKKEGENEQADIGKKQITKEQEEEKRDTISWETDVAQGRARKEGLKGRSTDTCISEMFLTSPRGSIFHSSQHHTVA